MVENAIRAAERHKTQVLCRFSVFSFILHIDAACVGKGVFLQIPEHRLRFNVCCCCVVVARMRTTRTAPRKKFTPTATTTRTPSRKTSTASTVTVTWAPARSASEAPPPTPNISWRRPKAKACWENRRTKCSSTLPSKPKGRGIVTTAPTSVSHTHRRRPSRLRRRAPVACSGGRRATARRRRVRSPGRSSLSARSAGRRPSALCPEPRAASVDSRS